MRLINIHKRATEDEMVGCITYSVDRNLAISGRW